MCLTGDKGGGEGEGEGEGGEWGHVIVVVTCEEYVSRGIFYNLLCRRSVTAVITPLTNIHAL